MKRYGRKPKQYGESPKSYGEPKQHKPKAYSKPVKVYSKPVKAYDSQKKAEQERILAMQIMESLAYKAEKISEPSFADQVTPLPRRKRKIRL